MAALPQSDPELVYDAPVTYDEWVQLPETNTKLELWNGEVIVSPAPELVHQILQSEFALQLGFAAKAIKRPGVLVLNPPTEVLFEDGTVVEPDILILTGRAGGKRSRRGVQGPPDLIVEFLSPGSRSHDLIHKSSLYAKFGVPEYWIVDPRNKTLIVGHLTDGMYDRMIVTGGSVPCQALDGAMIDISVIERTDQFLDDETSNETD